MFNGMNPFGGGGNPDGKPDGKNDNSKGASTSEKSAASGSQSPDFNSSGLERAAKAARELERSSNSREIIRLTTAQEVTKQKEQEAERAKFKLKSTSEKAQIINDIGKSIYDRSEFKNKDIKFDYEALLKGSAAGKIPTNIVKDKTEELNKNFSDFKILGKE